MASSKRSSILLCCEGGRAGGRALRGTDMRTHMHVCTVTCSTQNIPLWPTQMCNLLASLPKTLQLLLTLLPRPPKHKDDRQMSSESVSAGLVRGPKAWHSAYLSPGPNPSSRPLAPP